MNYKAATTTLKQFSKDYEKFMYEVSYKINTCFKVSSELARDNTDAIVEQAHRTPQLTSEKIKKDHGLDIRYKLEDIDAGIDGADFYKDLITIKTTLRRQV